jgi:hypothetical protein
VELGSDGTVVHGEGTKDLVSVGGDVVERRHYDGRRT